MSQLEQKELLEGLPKTLIIEVDDNLDFEDENDYVEISDIISSKISDESGFCHQGFDFSILQL